MRYHFKYTFIKQVHDMLIKWPSGELNYSVLDRVYWCDNTLKRFFYHMIINKKKAKNHIC